MGECYPFYNVTNFFAHSVSTTKHMKSAPHQQVFAMEFIIKLHFISNKKNEKNSIFTNFIKIELRTMTNERAIQVNFGLSCNVRLSIISQNGTSSFWCLEFVFPIFCVGR